MLTRMRAKWVLGTENVPGWNCEWQQILVSWQYKHHSVHNTNIRVIIEPVKELKWSWIRREHRDERSNENDQKHSYDIWLRQIGTDCQSNNRIKREQGNNVSLGGRMKNGNHVRTGRPVASSPTELGQKMNVTCLYSVGMIHRRSHFQLHERIEFNS